MMLIISLKVILLFNVCETRRQDFRRYFSTVGYFRKLTALV
jgi:hypothetical protein